MEARTADEGGGVREREEDGRAGGDRGHDTARDRRLVVVVVVVVARGGVEQRIGGRLTNNERYLPIGDQRARDRDVAASPTGATGSAGGADVRGGIDVRDQQPEGGRRRGR